MGISILFLSGCASEVKWMTPNIALCMNPPYQIVNPNKDSEQDIREAYLRNEWIDLVCEVSHDD